MGQFLMKTFLNVVGIMALFACGSLLGKTVPVVTERGVPRAEVRTVVQMFDYFHFRHGTVTTKDYGKLIDIFSQNLDPEHVYLTESDINQFRAKHGDSLQTGLPYLGELSAAYAMHGRFKQRVEERTVWIARQIKQWKVTPTADVSFLPSDSTWASRPELLDKVWERRLRNEWALEVIQGIDEQKAAAGLLQRYKRQVAYVSGRSEADIGSLFLNSFAELYDVRSAYFNPKTLSAFGITRVGIGATLNLVGGNCVFENILAGGPAALCGKIHPRDRLIAVQSPSQEMVEVKGLDLHDVTELTSGPEGSKVTVLIEHPYSLSRETIELTRGRLPAQHIRAYVHRGFGGGGRDIQLGVIAVPALYGAETDESTTGAAHDIRAALERLEAAGTEGVVLDLRGNGGGLLLEAIRAAGLFVGNVPIIHVKDHSGKVRTESTDQSGEVYSKPVVVLVDSVTASGAEIIAGALRDYGRAVVVGSEKTAGAGSIQAVLEIKNYLRNAQQPTGTLKMTVQVFYLPNGISTEQQGIAPDIVLPSSSFMAEPALPEHAAQARPDSLTMQSVAVDSGMSNRLAVLRAASEKRQAELPELLFLRRWTEEYFSYSQKPAGSLEQLRTAIRTRESAKARFMTEALELGRSGPHLQELVYPNLSKGGDQIAKGPSNALGSGYALSAAGNQIPDFALYEALRILADDIEFATQPTNVPSASTQK